MNRRNFRLRGFETFLVFAGLVALSHAEAPLTLSDVMRATLQNSGEARILAEKETKVKAQEREVLAGALPFVQLYANAGRGSSPFDPTAIGGPDSMGVFNPVLNRYSYGVEINQSLYSFGRLGQAYKVAGMLEASQVEANRRSRQQLAMQALDAFYGVVLSRARRNVIQASIRRQGEVVAFLESNFKMGAGQRSSVLLATSALKGLEPLRIRAESDADAARMSLNRLLGRPVENPLELDSVVASGLETTLGDTSDAGLKNILDRRPDLAALRLQKEAVFGTAKGFRMQYRPRLGAQGKVGILAYQLDQQLRDFDKNLDWQVGVGLQWPIFDGFAQSSRARQYESDARTLAHSESQAMNFARIEIESSLREAAASDTALEAAIQSRDAAEDARQLLTEDFRSGKGSVMDLLAAEEGSRNAEFVVLNSRYQRVRAQAALRMALGKDLIEEGSK